MVRRSIFTTRVLGDEVSSSPDHLPSPDKLPPPDTCLTWPTCPQVQVVVCPPFADSISEGDIRWEKAVGDTVSEDEVHLHLHLLLHLLLLLHPPQTKGGASCRRR